LVLNDPAHVSGNAEANFRGPEAGHCIIRCVVTKQMSSAIIGPKGNNARAIREESSCKVAIDTNVTSGQHGFALSCLSINMYS